MDNGIGSSYFQTWQTWVHGTLLNFKFCTNKRRSEKSLPNHEHELLLHNESARRCLLILFLHVHFPKIAEVSGDVDKFLLLCTLLGKQGKVRVY